MFKVFIEFVTVLLLFLCFGVEACGILSPRSGVEPTPLCIGRQSLNHWTTREVPKKVFLKLIFLESS